MMRVAAGLAVLVTLAAPLFVAQAAAQDVVVVATRVIYPGETVTSEALDLVTLKSGKQAPAAVTMAVGEIEGKVARRTILPRRYIPLSAVREPWLVERGAPARANFVHGGLTITITAVPLESGSAGDTIKLRNLDSGTVFTGTVLADGSVRVGAT